MKPLRSENFSKADKKFCPASVHFREAPLWSLSNRFGRSWQNIRKAKNWSLKNRDLLVHDPTIHDLRMHNSYTRYPNILYIELIYDIEARKNVNVICQTWFPGRKTQILLKTPGAGVILRILYKKHLRTTASGFFNSFYCFANRNQVLWTYFIVAFKHVHICIYTYIYITYIYIYIYTLHIYIYLCNMY